jgi:YqcI/YcgG family
MTCLAAAINASISSNSLCRPTVQRTPGRFTGTAGKARTHEEPELPELACSVKASPTESQLTKKMGVRSPHERSSLVAFLEPDPSMTDHVSFVARFGKCCSSFMSMIASRPQRGLPITRFGSLRLRGAKCSWLERLPPTNAAAAEISVQAWYSSSSPGLFIDPATSQPITASVRHSLDKRTLAYDGMSIHPDIGFYGNIDNREWKQYAIPDDNQPETGACPFHTRTR